MIGDRIFQESRLPANVSNGSPLIGGKRSEGSPEGGAVAANSSRKAVSDTSNLLVIVTNYGRGYGVRFCHGSEWGAKRQVGRAQTHAAS